MNSEVIKQILNKHLGTSKRTLIVGENTKRSNYEYYYELSGGDEDILTTAKVLNSGLGEDIKRRFRCIAQERYSEKKSRKKVNLPDQCIRFYQNGGDWELSLFNITSIYFHKSYKNKIVASISLSKYPVFSLTSYDEEKYYYGFFKNNVGTYSKGEIRLENGVPYWINKTLYNNKEFRSIAIDMLNIDAELSKNYILKDIAKTISEYGFFLPNTDYEIIKTFHTPRDLFETLYPETLDLNMNLNKLDMNRAFAISIIASVISTDDYKYLWQITSEVINDCFSMSTIYEGLRKEDVISAFYSRKITTINFHHANILANDYARMAINNNIDVRLSLSHQKLIQEHDRISKIDREKYFATSNKTIIRIPSKFDSLESQLNELYGNEYIRFKDLKSLCEEGNAQHNCVFTRRDLVEQDEVAIFRWNYEQKQYTIQFSIKNNNYSLDEIKGKYNSICSDEDIYLLKVRLEEVNRKIANSK